jgi:hypothetical protein
VRRLFRDFEVALGPVGASKGLHLLAPQFFPLWDQAIASRYGCPLYPYRRDLKYIEFMGLAKTHIRSFGGRKAVEANPLKVWDEFNYCRYTLELPSK